MAKRTTKFEPEPTPEVSNDDLLTAIRRVEKAVLAVAADLAVVSEDIDNIYVTIPKASLPPNDGPAPPESPPVEAAPTEPSPDAQSQAARNAAA